ncbi:hypothetical protein [Phreatobacter sp.]|uniref:hypothetical protein n=1 Tax=Phreatobacter sp. TaxID=1966341 RepID=UPI003F70FA37
MKPWGWGIAGGLVGLVAGFAATIAIGLVAFEVFKVSQREGAAAMGLVFMIGPVGAVIGAIIGATFAVWFARRSTRAIADKVTGERTNPASSRSLRLVVAVVAGGGVGYWIGLALLHLALAIRGSRSFDNYAAALALSHISTIVMLAGAALGAWIVLRRRASQA